MTPEVRSRVYIVAEGGSAPPRVAAVLEAMAAAALLVAAPAGKPLDAASARPLVELAQAKGIAALIEADCQLARTLRADGVHLPWRADIVASYAEAREILGQRYIVGADAGRSRHDAMTLGEAGADYVGFGIPAHVGDLETARGRRLDLVLWWSEIFEVPCVAFNVETDEDAAALARAGADFVALRMPAQLPSAELAAWARGVAGTLAAPEDVI